MTDKWIEFDEAVYQLEAAIVTSTFDYVKPVTKNGIKPAIAAILKGDSRE